MISATYWQRISANGRAPNVLFSRKKKNNGYIMNATSHFFEAIQLSMVTIFSLCWPLILLRHVRNRFSSTSCHVFSISVGFQLTLFPRVGLAGPFTPLCPLTGSRKLWIQTTAHFFVRHRSFLAGGLHWRCSYGCCGGWEGAAGSGHAKTHPCFLGVCSAAPGIKVKRPGGLKTWSPLRTSCKDSGWNSTGLLLYT
jgi:hypothetical protein